MTSRIILFGIIAGLIPLIGFFVMPHDGSIDLWVNMIVGFSLMILGAVFIFFAVRRYRDTVQGGTISFGKAFLIGLYMSLIAAVVYAGGWEIYIHDKVDEFIATYSNIEINQMRKKGASEKKIAARRIEQEKMFADYHDPLVRFGSTLMEISPITLLGPLVSAAILRRKWKPEL